MGDAGGRRPERVAIIGAGVIGAGWAARFRLNGVEVRVHDPAPAAARILDEVTASAVAAWQRLGLLGSDDELGPLALYDSVAEAVAGAELIQESVPEDLALKHRVLVAIDAGADPDAVISSSTSGLKPTELAHPLVHPDRLVVAHPFNPVYLLPLVEVVGGVETKPEVIERAMALCRSVGLEPLHVRVEIDAHIADRLLEAVWREALWLVNDGVATTAEIDDVIRYGFGLRWAQMGLFETYRIAGGEGGFGHFMAQFGPALSWPWSKLTDTPELTDELLGRLVAQSDDQSGHHSIRELERIRDQNLVDILLALEANDWGAGRSLATLRRSRAG